MRRTITLAVLFLATLLPRLALAQYPVQSRLCDVSYQNCRTQILDLINAETQSIDVAFWFMEDARYSNALINRFKAGVKVRVLFDTEAFSTDGPSIVRQQIIDAMRDAGIPLRYKSTGGILHWKLMVFGGQNIVNFSAANFSPVGYVPNSAYTDYEDEVVVFTTETSLVDTFKTKYDDVWTTTSGYANYANVTTLERYHPTTPLDSRLNFPPTQNYSTKIVQRLDAENVGIDIDMYRITDAKPADAAIRAVQRGVPVRLYTEQQQYRDVTRLWHSYNVDRMYAAGVQVRDRQHEGLNHQKTVILRGQGMVVHGSSNWTTPSASSQLEHNLFTTDPTYYNFFVDQFERKWNNTGPEPETKAFVPLPPDKPVYRTPANAATDVATNGVTLKWYGGPWAHKYDIYFGATPNPPLVASDVMLGPSETTTQYQTYTISTSLSPGTTYYWKVVSKTMANLTKNGDVWSFTTAGTTPPATLPDGWSTGDIGDVGASGNATYDAASGTYILSGSGADIWDTADEFRFVYTDLTGDGEIIARVASVSNTDKWTKAGVMMRETLDAGSRHASMFVSSAKGLAFQRRVSTGGVSTNTAGPSATAPYFVRLTRSGNLFSAYVSTNGSAWTLVGTQTIAMASSIKVGLALTSHLDGSVATGSFDGVSLTGGGTPPPPPPPPGSLPSGWQSNDVGSVSPAGSSTYDSGTSTFTVTGAGADIWGTADAFQFASTSLTGDGEIVARVATVQNVNAWTKAGVMMRSTTSAGSAHGMMVVTPGTTKGTAFQRRPATGGASASTAGPVTGPPLWVKLTRVGTTVSAYTSPDGSSWTLVDSDTIALDATIRAGLAVSSHVNGTAATATFDNVTVTTY